MTTRETAGELTLASPTRAKLAARAARHRAETRRYADSLMRMERAWVGRTLTDAQAGALRDTRRRHAYHVRRAEHLARVVAEVAS